MAWHVARFECCSLSQFPSEQKKSPCGSLGNYRPCAMHLYKVLASTDLGEFILLHSYHCQAVEAANYLTMFCYLTFMIKK